MESMIQLCLGSGVFSRLTETQDAPRNSFLVSL